MTTTPQHPALFWPLPLLLLTIFLSACSDEGLLEINTECGVVSNKVLYRPIKREQGTEVEIVNIIDSNFVIVRDDLGTMLVLLHGIGGSLQDVERRRAVGLYREMGDKAYFFRAEDECTLLIDGAIEVIPGNIISKESELSWGEEALKEAYVVPHTEDICGSQLLRNCYQALLLANIPPIPTPMPPTGEIPAS